MNDRIQKLLDIENLSPAQFADRIGVQRSSVSHILTGRNKPSFDFITKVLNKFPEVNADWLLLGKGEVYKTRKTAPTLFDSPPLQEKEKKMPESSSKIEVPEVKKGVEIDEKTDIPLKLSKNIKRIILFYEDNTFEEFTSSRE